MAGASKKRKRDGDEATLSLVEVYNNLADEDEITRLRAAQSLLEKFSDPEAATSDQVSTALRRLIRGLCSNRKAARIGFSIALTEFLSQIFDFTQAQRGFDASQAVEFLKSQTAPSESVSKQDERDHYFGRLFGAEAFLKSRILFTDSATPALITLLDLICELANKKPWMRQECGWVLYGCIAGSSQIGSDVAETILSALNSHKLIRSPEGVAIWLAVTQKFPKAMLPRDVWKHDNPLHKKENALLAKVMRDATPRGDDESKGQEAQGSATWNATLHFAWPAVLRILYENIDKDGESTKSKLIPFEQFWAEVVDASLFASSSSSERKHTGFLVSIAAINNAPPAALRFLLRGNFLRALINQSASGERLLHRAAQRTVHALLTRSTESPEASATILRALLSSTEGGATFDQVTKTKTLEKLVTSVKPETMEDVVDALTAFLQQPGTLDDKQAHAKRVGAADLLVQAFSQTFAEGWTEEIGEDSRAKILKAFATLSYFVPPGDLPAKKSSISPPLASSTRQILQARLSSCLERAMKSKASAMASMDVVVGELRRSGKEPDEVKSAVEMDEGVRGALSTAWTVLTSLQKQKPTTSPYLQAVKLLFSLSVLQVYNGDPDAVQILEELEGFIADSAEKSHSESADGIIEILLSFSSQPSKFLRRITIQVFQNFAPSITDSGLQSLTRILEADESVKGQQELFDAQPSDIEEEEDGSSDDEDDATSLDSDVEMLDSDVEEISAQNETSDSKSSREDGSSSSGEDDADDNDDEDGEDDELAAFDAKLAAALRTRKPQDDLDAPESSDSASDSTMSDSEMEALDGALSSVFAARKAAASKKKENKDARSNIIQFKNRVLDLLEVYLKQEHLNPLCLGLINPLLNAASPQYTKTNQISTRCTQLIRDYCTRCKGTKNLPQPIDPSFLFPLLSTLHSTFAAAPIVSLPTHVTTTASQASILIIKVLASLSPEKNIPKLVEMYAELRKKQLLEKDRKIGAGWFTDWGNWCAAFSQGSHGSQGGGKEGKVGNGRGKKRGKK
ncbi:putative dna polymerase [Phaeomoniella chlamydospora]|uniref:Putative dna polymerase n=1 Tax=Phaeomoniella chlamydospora TaxID=158046 RepID=A0A0G2EKY5_PHACM|nr:putative dna polymerase [Phaeomoniella chlamydospora]